MTFVIMHSYFFVLPQQLHNCVRFFIFVHVSVQYDVCWCIPPSSTWQLNGIYPSLVRWFGFADNFIVNHSRCALDRSKKRPWKCHLRIVRMKLILLDKILIQIFRSTNCADELIFCENLKSNCNDWRVISSQMHLST